MTQENYSKATLYSLIAYFLMALGMVFFKLLSGQYPFAQILAAECWVSLPLYLVLAMFQGGMSALKTHYPVKQAVRGVLQTIAAALLMWSLSKLPLSTTTMLSYISPLIITLLAIPLLGEKCSTKSLVFIFIGLAGVTLIAKPETGHSLAVTAAIASCFFWAGNALLMRRMDKDKIITFPFYTVMAGLIFWSIVCCFGYYAPFTSKDFLFASGAGVFFFVGAQFLFSAYRHAPFHFTTPFQYLQLVWTIILSYLIWAQIPTLVQLAGVAILIASSLWTLLHSRKAASTDVQTVN